jgi:hypothetical protein
MRVTSSSEASPCPDWAETTHKITKAKPVKYIPVIGYMNSPFRHLESADYRCRQGDGER